MKLNNQKGAATLVTAVILLIAITLVALLNGKTVLNESKIAADNYRITQATTAASYAMDTGVDYFNTGGFDQDGNSVADNIHTFDTDADGNNDELRLSSADASLTTFSTVTFSNDAAAVAQCGGDVNSWKSGLITALGFSDDRLATRTITQCVGPIGLLRDDGPKQPLVAQGNIALTGNARIINRFTNTTIWSGGEVSIGSSSAMETYILSTTLAPASSSGDQNLDPSNATDKARLLGTDEDVDTQLVSNNNLGNGLDIIDDDPSLGNLQGLDFFKNFFTTDSRLQLKSLAGTQAYTAMADAITNPVKTGLIWVEEADGSQTMNGGTIGSIDTPAILYINGDFTLAGNATIYGLLYVAGKYTISGTPTVVGANVVEGTALPAETPATPPIVSGTGTISLVYWQGFASDSDSPLPGLTTVISGSWRDW